MRLLAYCCFILVLSCVKNPDAQTKIVSPEEMQTLLKMENIQLVDVRTEVEYKTGFIPNAINIDFLSPTFMEQISKLDKDRPILVYCEKGGRSAKCSETLKAAGFKKIYDLEGGYSKWKFNK